MKPRTEKRRSKECHEQSTAGSYHPVPAATVRADNLRSPPGSVHDMTPAPDHGEESYRGSGRLERAQGADHRRRLGHRAGGRDRLCPRGSRRGALNYLPSEEADAQEVVKLIEAAGRKAVALPGDITSEAFCTSWSATRRTSSAVWTSWSTTPASRQPARASPQ